MVNCAQIVRFLPLHFLFSARCIFLSIHFLWLFDAMLFIFLSIYGMLISFYLLGRIYSLVKRLGFNNLALDHYLEFFRICPHIYFSSCERKFDRSHIPVFACVHMLCFLLVLWICELTLTVCLRDQEVEKHTLWNHCHLRHLGISWGWCTILIGIKASICFSASLRFMEENFLTSSMIGSK